MAELQGRTAVITGAGSGIGQGLAEEAAARGMRVVLADVDADRVEEIAEGLRASGAEALAVPTDVTDADAVDRLADAAVEAYGPVALLVNNAGVETVGRIWDLPPERWRRLLDVNVTGVFHGLRSFVPRMGADPAPSYVVNVASVGALATAPLNSAYHASKHAVLALTECAYLECLEQHPQVAVSVVCPGAVRTRIFEDAYVADGSPGSDIWQHTMQGYLEQGGITPKQAAAAVLDGLGTGFWINTHPDEFAFFAGRRAEMLTAQTPPPPPAM
ncbi:SDR family NAD(P)-dependent oxidoreductase [Nocardioides sp. NPDC057577]|uniref:SDR family NAD(P)-dependent oxidoreductase n=1 Tax=Nocardioides sp. NPDC057577 TaxID=3346171 RepID=UPI0036716993